MLHHCPDRKQARAARHSGSSALGRVFDHVGRIFEPATAMFGLSPIRADRISATGEIPDQIFEYLRDADIVIADLSHANPNVMYELGLRHSRPGITIQVGEYGLLPFDVTIRTIQFNRTTAGLIGARDDLIVALRTALTDGGSALRATTVFGGGGSPRGGEAVAQDVARSVAPDADEIQADEPGFLEVLADGEVAIAHLSEVLSSAQVRLGAVNEIVADAGNQMPASFAGRLQVARTLATTLQPDADGLESDTNDFYGDINAVDAMLQWVFERIGLGRECGHSPGLP